MPRRSKVPKRLQNVSFVREEETFHDVNLPCVVSGLKDVEVIRISANGDHSAAISENGEVKTWGWGEHGQLGLGNTNDETNPQLVSLGSIYLQTKEIEVYCGSGFTYAVRRKQKLYSSPTSS